MYIYRYCFHVVVSCNTVMVFIILPFLGAWANSNKTQESDDIPQRVTKSEVRQNKIWHLIIHIILNKYFHVKQPIGKRFKMHRTQFSIAADIQCFYYRKCKISLSLQVEKTVIRNVSTLHRHPKSSRLFRRILSF